ncbi:MAG: efflux RND transporter periplasmic adaptor subunit [Phascolarctobacterium sp.]|uniref:efflux RND transporter periplasmic adaptor subunit n=1 Tax=Phascolarctobacterium sp. TaxID=2049039 RepID=UPI0026DDC9DF|nr:efflux RND transporter periplasmic adaptor subunit [Phascolarctobacterium sp.]MDO4921289.1 efflux RND transporter periplasmic adaptor subunit [Phascolarctobacterium sp.]
MMMKKILSNPANQKKIAAALAVIVLAGGGAVLYRNITNTPEQAKVVPLVRTFTAGTAAADVGSVYPGEVRGRYESQLAFQVAGKINARMVNVGDRVAAGQVLLTLDPKDVNQSVEADSAQLASAAANHKLAADNAARYNSLYAQGAVSEAVRDQYNTQLEAASAALRQARAQANISSHQLGYTQLVSDADGVVAAVNAEIGQVVAAGTPIATVVRSGQREIQINVPEDARVQLGQPAQISFWALPNVTAAGTVREIAPMADPVARTYKVCIAVPDLPEAARLGMTAKVTLLSDTDSSQQLLIPATALYQVDGQPQVWVVRDKHAQLTDVRIAGYEGNMVRIADGLTPGDVIITAGLSKLTPNQEVRVEEGGES